MTLQEMDWMIYLRIFHTGVLMNDLKDQVRFSFAVRQTLLGEVREKVSISIFPTCFEYHNSIHRSNQVHELYYHFSKIKPL